MRPILCNKCMRKFRGGGQSRVMKKLLFFFCAGCWARRAECEAHMRRVAL